MSTRLKAELPEYFIDDSPIHRQYGLTRRWMKPDILTEPVIVPDRPWESRTLTFPSVVKLADGRMRLYYSGLWHMQRPLGWPRIMIAESDDGFHWHKPELGLIDWHGSTANNIVATRHGHMELAGVVRDETGSAGDEFKLLTFEADSLDGPWKPWTPDRGLYARTGADGLKWRLEPEGRCIDAGDRTSPMATKVDGRYVAFTRHKDMFEQTGQRSIYRMESENFSDWTEPELVLTADLLDPPEVELYGMSVFERHGIYWGLVEAWNHTLDIMQVQLAYSYDSRVWHRPPDRMAFISPEFPWNRRWNNCASNGLSLVNEQMLFYFSARAVGHDFDTARQHGVIAIAALRQDRFCAIEGHDGGMLETKTVQWPGGDLELNADTRSSIDAHPRQQLDGIIQVEVLDADGVKLPGYSGTDGAAFTGNTIARGGLNSGVVRWPGDRSLDHLAGQRIRLRFGITRARLYTFQALR
jgi:hypothetical protein